MKILVCPDKFKGSLTSVEFCAIAQQALGDKDYELTLLPLADGGEGSLDCLYNYLPNLLKVEIKSFNAINHPITTFYLVDNTTAYIELALQSGLEMIPSRERNVQYASTFGTGLVIKNAIQNGCKKIFLFVGGSATNDGGLGLAQACGFTFLNENNQEIQSNLLDLIELIKINYNGQIDFSTIELILATDVNNPLLGSQGATCVYGPQKGVTTELMPKIEKGLKQLNKVILHQNNIDVSYLEGSGAAGGVALTLCGLMGAKIISATQYIFEICQLDSHIQNADVVITGEGKFDAQSLQGKLVGEIIKMCTVYDKLCYIICGQSELPSQANYEVWPLTQPNKS